uniref:Protein MGA2 n=1 Tax=Parastrongyloides trichosuri TaxID=131310 RepID=A0A0N4Z345_PARTI
MSYRKSSYNNPKNFSYNSNLNSSYSSSNVPSHTLAESSSRGLYSRRESKTSSFADFSSLKQPLFSSNEQESSKVNISKNNDYLFTSRKSSYLTNSFKNTKLDNQESKNDTQGSTYFGFNKTTQKVIDKTLPDNFKKPNEDNLQQEFLKRLLNAHNTVDNLLRGRGLHIEDESNYLRSKFNRQQEVEAVSSKTERVPRFSTNKFNFVTKKYSQSTPSTTDSESSSAYSSSSMENSPLSENVSESDDTSVDSLLHTDIEDDSADEENPPSFLEIDVPEYVLISPNTFRNEEISTIFPFSKIENDYLSITSKNIQWNNPLKFEKGFCKITLSHKEESVASLTITVPHKAKKSKKDKHPTKDKPIMVKKMRPVLKKQAKCVEEDEDNKMSQCKAEISIQHYSYSFAKSKKNNNLSKPEPILPIEKLIRLHLRLTNHPPSKADVSTIFILNKQTIAVDKTIKICKKRKKSVNKRITTIKSNDDKKQVTLKNVDKNIFDKQNDPIRKLSLTPQYNLKVPEVFLKDNNKLLFNNNDATKSKAHLSGINIFKMVANKQICNKEKVNIEDRYKSVRSNLKKVDFIKSISPKLDLNNNSTSDEENIPKENRVKKKSLDSCIEIINKYKTINKSITKANSIESDIIDKKLIERFCNTDHIPKPLSIIKNYCIPTKPKESEISKKILSEENKNNEIPRFVKYKIPKRIIVDEAKTPEIPVPTKLLMRGNSVVQERKNTVNERFILKRSCSECPKSNKNVHSHSLYNFGVSLKSVKERLLQTKEELDNKPPKETFVPHWRKNSGEEEEYEEEEVEEVEEAEPEETEEAEHEHDDEEAKTRKNLKDFEVDDANMTEGEKAMLAAKRRQEEEDKAKVIEYEEKRRIEREREEEELRKLKEKQERRRLEREAEEREAAEKLRIAEERRKQEEEERKARMEAEKRKKEEDAKRRSQMMGGSFAAAAAAGTGGRNFVIPEKKEKSADKFGNIVQAKQEMGMTKEQQEEAKRAYMITIAKGLDLSNILSSDLKEKIKTLHQRICKLEVEKYDLEKRHERQVYDLKELNERQRQVARNTALKKGVDPADAGGRHPPKVCISSKYDRQTDRRSFKEKRAMFDTKYAFPCFPNVPPPPTIYEKKIKPETGEGKEDHEEYGEYEEEYEEEEE